MGEEMNEQAGWTRAVIQVWRGRGFVVGTDRERFVITASHCLPQLPPRHPASYTHERTYPKLLGPLRGKRTVWAECLFVDPVADLAILGEPDDQALSDECDAYRALVEAAAPLPIAHLPLVRPTISTAASTISSGPGKMVTLPEKTILGRPEAKCAAWLLSLEGQWFRCDVHAGSRGLMTVKAAEEIAAGMSGSPIVSDGGEAIGVAVIGGYTTSAGERIVSWPCGPYPLLSRNLPARLLDEVTVRRRRRSVH